MVVFLACQSAIAFARRRWRADPLWREEYERQREEWEANLRDVPISSARYRQERRQKELERLANLGAVEVPETVAVVRGYHQHHRGE